VIFLVKLKYFNLHCDDWEKWYCWSDLDSFYLMTLFRSQWLLSTILNYSSIWYIVWYLLILKWYYVHSLFILLFCCVVLFIVFSDHVIHLFPVTGDWWLYSSDTVLWYNCIHSVAVDKSDWLLACVSMLFGCLIVAGWWSVAAEMAGSARLIYPLLMQPDYVAHSSAGLLFNHLFDVREMFIVSNHCDKCSWLWLLTFDWWPFIPK